MFSCDVCSAQFKDESRYITHRYNIHGIRMTMGYDQQLKIDHNSKDNVGVIGSKVSNKTASLYIKGICLFSQISISEITKQNLPPQQAKNPFGNKGVASGKINEDDELSSNHHAEVQVNKY